MRPRGEHTRGANASRASLPTWRSGHRCRHDYRVSIFLIAAGAILRYATNLHVSGIEIDTVGLILMLAGAAGLLLGLLQEAIWSDRARARRGVVVDDGREGVVERDASQPPARY